MDNTEQPASTLYVAIPPSPLFAAHWSFFIPDEADKVASSEQKQGPLNHGRRIHVSGDRLNGFKLEIIRDYSVKAHRSVGSRLFAIGRMPLRFLAESEPAKDKLSEDKYEQKDRKMVADMWTTPR